MMDNNVYSPANNITSMSIVLGVYQAYNRGRRTDYIIILLGGF